MRFRLIIILLVVGSSLTAAPTVTPQAMNELDALRTTAKGWARLSLLNGLLTIAMLEKADAGRTLFEARPAIVASAPGAEEFRWNGRVAAGRTVEIKGVNGHIRAEPASGGEVEVVASKHAKQSNPGEVQIKVIEHEGGVTICAVYPSGDANHVNDCTAGKNWSSHTRNNDVRVDFRVRVPANLSFVGRTVNGGVETGAMDGDVEAFTVNGDVNISARGYAIASTVNGSITAAMRSADWPRALKFTTVNGAINLQLPAAASTTVNAETVSGDINTDFDLTVQGRFSRRRLNGTIGDGKHQLMLKTVNGEINLRRGQ